MRGSHHRSRARLCFCAGAVHRTRAQGLKPNFRRYIFGIGASALGWISAAV